MLNVVTDYTATPVTVTADAAAVFSEGEHIWNRFSYVTEI
jgi:hypothetical protein